MTEMDMSCNGVWDLEGGDLQRETTGCTEVRALQKQQTVNEPRFWHLGTGLLPSPFNNLPSPHPDIHSVVYLLSENLFISEGFDLFLL